MTGCDEDGRRRKRRARLGRQRQQSAGLAGATPPCPPPGSPEGKEGAPLGDDDECDDADAAAFAGRGRDDDDVINEEEEEECKMAEERRNAQSWRRGGEGGREGWGQNFTLCVAVPSAPPLILWRVPSWHRLWAVKTQILLPSSCSCSDRCGGWCCDEKLTLANWNYESPVVLCVVCSGVWDSLLTKGGGIFLIVIQQYVSTFLHRVILFCPSKLRSLCPFSLSHKTLRYFNSMFLMNSYML